MKRFLIMYHSDDYKLKRFVWIPDSSKMDEMNLGTMDEMNLGTKDIKTMSLRGHFLYFQILSNDFVVTWV